MIPGIVAGAAVAGGGGAGPNYLSATGTSFETAGTSHAVPMPATVNVGDLLLMQITTMNATISTPSGWTQVFTANNSTACRFSVFYRIADGSEGGTTVSVTMSSSLRATAIVHRVQAGTFDAGTAPSAPTAATGLSDSPQPPAHSPAWGAASTLWIPCYGQRNTSGATFTAPYPGNPTQVKNAFSGTAYCNTGSCHTTQNTATLTPGSFYTGASSNAQWVASTVAIRPA